MSIFQYTIKLLHNYNRTVAEIHMIWFMSL